jgi:Tol biopolymer transport system component/DNA-binding winged helix-turn-helix (wHTH) protein
VKLGDWTLHADLGVLRRASEERRLNAKALHVLLVLVDADGSAVSRDDLLNSVWGDSYPTDAVVSRAIADLRSAFGEAAGDQTYIRTVPKFGYQLVAEGAAAKARRPLPWVYAVVPTLLILILWWSWPPAPPAVQLSLDRLPIAKPLTADPGLEHQPRITAGGGWVVYAALRPNQGDWDIFRVSTNDGSSQAVAAVPGVNEHGPAVSPDGEQLAYVRISGSDCDVVLQSVTFGVPQTVAQCTSKFPTLVDWAPGDNRIAYTNIETNDPDGYRRLYELHLDTNVHRQLSDAVSPTGSDFYPRYSPSGRYVAFLRGEPQPDHRSSLWIVDTGSGNEQRLTPQAAQLGGMTWFDDATLLYSINDAGHFEMRRISIEGGLAVTIDGPDLIHPEYNALQRKLVASSRRSERDLALIDATGKVTAVGSSTSDDHHGVLQPGQEFAAYISRRSGYDEIWLVDINTSDARQLTSFAGATIRYPAWHPDGLHLLFTLQSDAGERIYELDVLSGATRQIGDSGIEATTPRWTSDGKAWVFGCNESGAWGICIADTVRSRRIANGYFRPTPIDDESIAVVDGDGHLFRMSIEHGTTELIWDGLPGAGRYGWTIAANSLYYIYPVATDNTARIIRRDLGSGAEVSLYNGPMPMADTPLSVSKTTGDLLFTRFQASSDDLVIFDVSDSGSLRR